MSDYTTKIEDTMNYEGSGKVGLGANGNRADSSKSKKRVKTAVGKTFGRTVKKIVASKAKAPAKKVPSSKGKK